jgi:CRISPR-associated endonuclease Cas1
MASHTLPQSSVISQIPRHGTLCLFGFGIRVSVLNGKLSCHDGIGTERRSFLLSKVNSNLKRLVLIGSDGSISLEAIRWIADRDASFHMLDRRGKPLVVCGPSAPSDARLRRAQSLALENGVALRISKELIRQKLAGQAMLINDMLCNSAGANLIHSLSIDLAKVETLDSVRLIESQAGRVYWQSWARVPIRWVRKDEPRVNPHWKMFDSRISPLTRSPRLAVNPPNSILSVLYSILEAEARLACVAMGCDVSIGLLHVDTPARDSLVFDVLEPIRPKCDAFVLDWIQHESFRKADFHEDRRGNCRVSTPLAIKLCQTASTWRKMVSPIVEYVAQALWASRATKGEKMLLPTRLTQRHKRKAKGSSPFPPEVVARWRENLCRECGKVIRHGHTRCAECAVSNATENLVIAAQRGRALAHTPEARAKCSDTQRGNAIAQHSWSPADLPEWLTSEVFLAKIQPQLAHVSASLIARSIGVSRWYAGRIKEGYRPHPRHWQALAQLVRMTPNL